MAKTIAIKSDNEILNNIFHLIKVKGVRQKDLADYLGISQNAITQWKICKTTSYMNYIDKLASFFDVTTDEILNPDKNKLHESLLSPDEMEMICLYRKITNEVVKKSLIVLMSSLDGVQA